jgi:hypothetical protein
MQTSSHSPHCQGETFSVSCTDEAMPPGPRIVKLQHRDSALPWIPGYEPVCELYSCRLFSYSFA